MKSDHKRLAAAVQRPFDTQKLYIARYTLSSASKHVKAMEAKKAEYGKVYNKFHVNKSNLRLWL